MYDGNIDKLTIFKKQYDDKTVEGKPSFTYMRASRLWNVFREKLTLKFWSDYNPTSDHINRQNFLIVLEKNQYSQRFIWLC